MSDNCSPDCPLCGGYGWVRTETDDINSPDFGKLIRCPNAPKNYNNIGLERNEWEFSIDKLKQTNEVKLMRKAIGKLFTDGRGMLYICGGFGIGKTYTLKSAVIEAVNKGYEAYYIRHNMLIDSLRQAYDDKSGQSVYRERMDDYKKIGFLAIDEYGRERMTEFSKNAMSELYDYRYEKAISGNLITILASNFPPEMTMDEYMQSRANDYRCSVLKLNGRDFRKGG